MQRLLLLALSVFAFASCNKDDDGTDLYKPSCRITTVSMVSAGDSTHYTIAYNSDGRVISVIEREGAAFTTRNFAYTGNSAIVTETNSSQRDSVVLNNDGLVSLHRSSFSQSSAWSQNAYEYSGTELQRSLFSTAFGGVPDTTRYTWSGGNLIRQEDGSYTMEFEYYLDKPASALGADMFTLFQFLQTGGVTIRNKNLLKSVKMSGFGNTVTNLLYEFDEDGKVTSVNYSDGSQPGSGFYRYGYSCE